MCETYTYYLVYTSINGRFGSNENIIIFCFTNKHTKTTLYLLAIMQCYKYRITKKYQKIKKSL